LRLRNADHGGARQQHAGQRGGQAKLRFHGNASFPAPARGAWPLFVRGGSGGRAEMSTRRIGAARHQRMSSGEGLADKDQALGSAGPNARGGAARLRPPRSWR
jgi:hypothetical protein